MMPIYIYLRKDDAHDSNRGNRGVDGPCISSKTCGCDSLESTVRLTITQLSCEMGKGYLTCTQYGSYDRPTAFIEKMWWMMPATFFSSVEVMSAIASRLLSVARHYN